jgi:hypothetical protein
VSGEPSFEVDPAQHDPSAGFAELVRRDAAARALAGHELLFAGPPELAGPVDGAGFEFWQFDPPPEDELGAIWGRVPELPPEEANEVVVGEIFGRLNTTAGVPRLRAACEQWRPDVVVRDPNEYGSALAAELHGVPHARVAVGLASVEELGLGIAASAIDAIRPPDPGRTCCAVPPT